MRGANFTGASVRIDRNAITPLSHSESEIRIAMPPRENNGYAVISVRGATTTASAEFLYVPPRLTDIAPGAITTIAGVGNYLRDFGRANEATVQPGGIALDGSGNLFIAQPGPGTILRVMPDGQIERFAGSGDRSSPPGNGINALDAYFEFPTALAVDPAGNVYVPDHNGRLCRVDPSTGMVTSIAGTGHDGFSGDDGPAVDAEIGLPTFVAADAHDVYFIDYSNHRIRRVRDGIIATIAGNGSAGYSGDGGPATLASFDLNDSDSGALALDSSGNLYLGDAGNRRIRRIDRNTGIITTIVDTHAAPFDVGFIRAIAFDAAGNLYYSGGGTIVEASPSGAFVRSWHRTAVTPSLADDVPYTDAYMGHIVGLAIDKNGDILYSDDQMQRVRRLSPLTGRITTIAGIGPKHIGAGGPAYGAYLVPNDVAFNAGGELLIADACCGPGGGGIRKIDASGNLVTIAGFGLAINNGDNVAPLEASIIALSLDIDAENNIDFVDGTSAYRVEGGLIRALNTPDAQCRYDGDGGPARLAHVCQPWDAVRDRNGNLFIADTNNNRIRRIDRASGVITTIAGNGQPPNGFERYGQAHSCGDGGAAFDACLNTPYGLAFDANGSLFVSEGAQIRRIDPNGTISTFNSGAFVTKMAFDRASYLYAGRSNALLRFRPDGELSVLATGVSFVGQSAGIAIDAEGNIFFCDGQSRVRAMRYGAVLAPQNGSITATTAGPKILATVRDGAGRLAPGVRVEFTAPSSGPSCSAPFAITDASGIATTTCTPNCIAGSYTVEARPLGASSAATVAFTNPARPCRARAVRH